MFKDEAEGKQIKEFIALRSKLYSYKIANEEHKKCKGIKKNVVGKNITHADYIKSVAAGSPLTDLGLGAPPLDPNQLK